MTSTIKAASNGSASAAAGKPERASGITRVQESEAYHAASVAHDAAFEAERLCNDIYRVASDAYLRDSGTSEAAAVLRDQVTLDKIQEAISCLAVAGQYLRDLLGEPPF
jgi:hypothetical protein